MNENLIGGLGAIFGVVGLLGLRNLVVSIGKSRKPKRVRDEEYEAVYPGELRGTPVIQPSQTAASSDHTWQV